MNIWALWCKIFPHIFYWDNRRGRVCVNCGHTVLIPPAHPNWPNEDKHDT